MSSVENLPPIVIKKISQELQDLLQTPPEGIKVFLNEENITDVEAAILGPEGTPYSGGVFRVKLVLPSDFPNSPPKGFFLTKIFHPNVSSNGDICVSTLKKDWKKDLGIKHILLTIKCLLIVPNPESALNEEAGKLLLEKYEDFVKHAKMITGIHAQNKGDFKVTEVEEGGEEGLEGSEASSKKRTAEKLDKQKAEKKKNLKRL